MTCAGVTCPALGTQQQTLEIMSWQQNSLYSHERNIEIIDYYDEWIISSREELAECLSLYLKYQPSLNVFTNHLDESISKLGLKPPITMKHCSFITSDNLIKNAKGLDRKFSIDTHNSLLLQTSQPPHRNKDNGLLSYYHIDGLERADKNPQV